MLSEEIDYLFTKISGIFQDKWRTRSACIGTEYDFFNTDHVENIKEICANCPVKVECLDDAMYYGDEGIRGGMTEDERISLFLYRKRHSSVFKHDTGFLIDETCM